MFNEEEYTRGLVSAGYIYIAEKQPSLFLELEVIGSGEKRWLRYLIGRGSVLQDAYSSASHFAIRRGSNRNRAKLFPNFPHHSIVGRILVDISTPQLPPGFS